MVEDASFLRPRACGRGEVIAMETSYRELKCKFVVNVSDGRNLGKTSDIVFTYPEGRVLGIAVPGKNGLRLFKREDVFISLHNVVKIGADVVLVDLKTRPGEGKRDERGGPGGCGFDGAP